MKNNTKIFCYLLSALLIAVATASFADEKSGDGNEKSLARIYAEQNENKQVYQTENVPGCSPSFKTLGNSEEFPDAYYCDYALTLADRGAADFAGLRSKALKKDPIVKGEIGATDQAIMVYFQLKSGKVVGVPVEEIGGAPY